jgi:hypothetical protein
MYSHAAAGRTGRNGPKQRRDRGTGGGGEQQQQSSSSPSKALRLGALAAKESEVLLERLFLSDHYRYLLRLWHLGTYSATLQDVVDCYRDAPARRYVSSEAMLRAEVAATAAAREGLFEYVLSTQQRRVSMDILSHLCSLATAFRDQLQRINAIPKLLVVVGSPGIVVCGGSDYEPYARHNAHGNLPLSLSPLAAAAVAAETALTMAVANVVAAGDGASAAAAAAAAARTDWEERERDRDSAGRQAAEEDALRARGEPPAGYRLDIGTVRAALRLLVNLVVMQSPKKRATVVRLLQEVPIGGARFNLALKKVSQRDETCAFYFATLLSLQYAREGDADDGEDRDRD